MVGVGDQRQELRGDERHCDRSFLFRFHVIFGGFFLRGLDAPKSGGSRLALLADRRCVGVIRITKFVVTADRPARAELLICSCLKFFFITESSIIAQ